MTRTRIETLEEMVPPGSRVADIGTDRALLPRRLLASLRAGHCVATELTAARLERARSRAIELRDDPRIEWRAGDGLTVLRPSDRIDVVVLAGLGGERIRKILEHGSPAALGVGRIVVQPQTDAGLVRGWLGAHGFPIVEECLVVEQGRFFTIVAAQVGAAESPAGAGAALTAEDLLEVGPLLAASGAPEVREYWRRELARLEGILRDAGGGEGRGRREALQRRALAQRVLALLDS